MSLPEVEVFIKKYNKIQRLCFFGYDIGTVNPMTITFFSDSNNFQISFFLWIKNVEP